MNVIPEELQHAIVVADIDKKKISNVVRTRIAKSKISLLKGGMIRKGFKEKVIELVDVGGLNLS